MDKKNFFVKNPYPGIRSFNISESHLFFGREKQISELNDILKRSKFVAITGASGSGKSSLVKAGLIPSLAKNDEQWCNVIFRPGNAPFENAANAFVDLFVNEKLNDKKLNNPTEIKLLLEKGPKAFIDFLKNIPLNKKMVIYVDQFEEIFRFRENKFKKDTEILSENFVNFLIDISQEKTAEISVVISLRSDFLSDCTNFSRLPDLINDGHYLIPKMTLDEMQKAFKGPAEVAGAKLSDELTETLSNDIQQHYVGLPILQHALMRTWDYWLINSQDSNVVELEHYNAIGTVRDALSVHAEQIYGNLANDEQRKITEKLFKALTYLGEDNRGTRRPTSLADICAISGKREADVIEIIDIFRAEKNSFLFPTPDIVITPTTIIDISHESIMRIWKRLVDWVRDETESAQLYLRISKSAELFQQKKTGLLVNPDLMLALNWLKENAPNETWAKRYDGAFDRTINYIDASKNENDRIIAVTEKRKQNALKRTRFFVIFLSAASIISILFLVVALNLQYKAEASEIKAKEKEKIAVKESKVAEEKRKEAISQGKIAEQQKLIAEEQKLLAEAQKLFAITQQNEAMLQKKLAELAKVDAEVSRDKALTLQKQAEILRDEALEQKKRAEKEKNRAEYSEAKTDTLRRLAIAQALAANAIKVKNEQTNNEFLSDKQKQLPAILALQAYYFNKNYGGNSDNPEVYAALAEVADASQIIKGANAHTAAVRSISVSPDGKFFVSCSDDGTLKRYNTDNLQTPEVLKTPALGQIAYRSVLVLKNGLIIAGSSKGHILVWNKENITQKPTVLNAHTTIVTEIVASPDETSFYSAAKDGTVKMWNTTDFSAPKTVFASSEEIIDMALTTSNDNLFIATLQGNIYVLETTNFQQKQKIQTNNGEINAMCVISNQLFFVGYSNGKVEYRTNTSVNELVAHSSGVTNILYNTTNFITSSYEGSIKIWDMKQYQTKSPLVINKHEGWVMTITLTPDNKKIISGSEDKNIIVTEIDIDEIKNKLRANLSENMSKNDWQNFVGPDIEYSPNLPQDK